MKPFFIEIIGRTIGVTAGCLFSPSWLIIHWTLAPYMDIQALLNPDTSFSAMIMFVQAVQNMSGVETAQLLMLLVLGIVVSFGYLFVCSQLGRYIAKLIMTPRTQTATN